MKGVVVGIEKAEGSRVHAKLREAGFDVRLVWDAKEAMTTLASQPAELALICADTVTEPICELVARLRERCLLEPAQILLLADPLTDDVAVRIYGAGLDGELPRGCSVPHLVARARAVERMVASVERRKTLNGRPAGAGRADAPGCSALERVTHGATWTSASVKLRDIASQFLSIPAEVRQAPNASGAPPAVAFVIVLSNVQQQIELRLAVGTDARSGQMLSAHMFGPGEEAMAADMLGELANVFMGALKTSFNDEAMLFTGGLPSAIKGEHVLSDPVVYHGQDSFSLVVADATILVHLGILSKGNVHVPTEGLREGMILAKNVYNAKGLLLIQGGTRLSSNMVDKLRNILPNRSQVEVMTG